MKGRKQPEEEPESVSVARDRGPAGFTASSLLAISAAAQRPAEGKVCAPQPATYSIAPSRLKDVPERMRPREQFERSGAEHVSDEVLVALILRSGTRGTNVVELSQRLLQDFGSLNALAKASVDELAAVRGMGKVKAQVLRAALEMGRRLAEEKAGDRPVVRVPADVSRLLRERAMTREEEVFWVLLLDRKNRLKKPPVEVTRGLLDASLVHPREVFREAVRSATAAIVLAHNHPSGDPTPSSEDLRITKQLVEAGRVVDIQVLDHIILGRLGNGVDADFFSLRESGLVSFPS